jgi:hypothetical protein
MVQLLRIDRLRTVQRLPDRKRSLGRTAESGPSQLVPEPRFETAVDRLAHRPALRLGEVAGRTGLVGLSSETARKGA